MPAAPAGARRGDSAAALADDLPHLKRDGGFVRDGYRADLDEARKLRDDSRRVIAGLQAHYAAETDIRTLKIKHNNVLGYFIEVGASHGERLLAAPLNARFIHRQTLASAVRFTTTELADLEAKIAGAGDRALADRARRLRRADRRRWSRPPMRSARSPTRSPSLDVAAALAVLAEAENYCRPTVDDSLAFAIAGGRHPVVEQALRGERRRLRRQRLRPRPATASDAGRIWLVTGPNMAGKSTFLRQNALIAILAQIGSYVPARSAHIGIVDRLFSRVGAADDLARGRSTFMVEMVETAAILNQAGPRSLVILDEIGRGTATFDGLSIAWAAIEHLHEVNRSRALFATHYHELTALAAAPAAARQRHRAGQGMEGRRHLPARDRAGLRRPLLRHPGRPPRRPAGLGRRARPRGAAPARGDRPQVAGPHAHRRPAALLRRAPQAEPTPTGRPARRRCSTRSRRTS